MLRQKPHVPHTDIQAALMAAHSHQLPILTTGTFQSVHTSTLAFLPVTKRLSPTCRISGKRLMPTVTRRLKHSYTLRPKRYALSTTTPATWTVRTILPTALPQRRTCNSFLPLRHRRTTSTPCTQRHRKRHWRLLKPPTTITPPRWTRKPRRYPEYTTQVKTPLPPTTRNRRRT